MSKVSLFLSYAHLLRVRLRLSLSLVFFSFVSLFPCRGVSLFSIAVFFSFSFLPSSSLRSAHETCSGHFLFVAHFMHGAFLPVNDLYTIWRTKSYLMKTRRKSNFKRMSCLFFSLLLLCMCWDVIDLPFVPFFLSFFLRRTDWKKDKSCEAPKTSIEVLFQISFVTDHGKQGRW